MLVFSVQTTETFPCQAVLFSCPLRVHWASMFHVLHAHIYALCSWLGDLAQVAASFFFWHALFTMFTHFLSYLKALNFFKQRLL